MWKLVLLLLGIVAMVGVACGDGGDDAVPPDTADPVPFPTEAPAPETAGEEARINPATGQPYGLRPMWPPGR